MSIDFNHTVNLMTVTMQLIASVADLELNVGSEPRQEIETR